MLKRSIEQEIRNKNFGSRNGNVEKNAVVKNQGTKQRVQRILGDCWQWEFNGQCVKGDNCSFRHDINKRGKVTPSNPSPNSFMQQSERKPSRTRSPRGRSPSGRTSRWPCKGQHSLRLSSDARQLGCVFQDMTPPKSILRKTSDMQRPIQRVKFTKAIARHTKNSRPKSFARLYLPR